MQSPEGFQIPEDFIHRLNEYTRGYLLVVCNEEGAITSYEAFDNPIIKLGLLSFTKTHVDAYHEYRKNKALKHEEIDDPDEEEDE
jgi:hypothetical protein